jgi:hypothetical protein
MKRRGARPGGPSGPVLLAVAALATGLSATEAAAFCTAPRLFEAPPTPPHAQLPQRPLCLSPFPLPETACTDQELAAFQLAALRHLGELAHFAASARSYADAAAAFAFDAEAYLRCVEGELAVR